MDGSSGRFTVRLSDPRGVMPTFFTVDHAHHSVAHSLASAPRQCEVWGYRSADDEQPVQLAEFEYDIHGKAAQTVERNLNKENPVRGGCTRGGGLDVGDRVVRTWCVFSPHEPCAGVPQDFFPLVQLRIKSNWGNPYHTCLYRFRVHGNVKSSMPVAE